MSAIRAHVCICVNEQATEQKKTVKLELQVKRLTVENEKLQANAGAGNDEGEVEELKSQLAELEAKNTQLDEQLDEAKRNAKEGAKAVSELDRERKKREAADKKVASLQADLDKLEAEVETLRSAKHDMEDQLSACEW